MNGPACLLHSLPVYKHPSPGSEEPPAPLTVLLILSLFLRRTEGSVLPAEQQVMEWLLLGVSEPRGRVWVLAPGRNLECHWPQK